MKRAKVNLATNAGTETVTAYLPKTLGLCVHRDLLYQGCWNVSHIATGLALPGDRFKSRRAAEVFANALDIFTDWENAPPEEIRAAMEGEPRRSYYYHFRGQCCAHGVV